MHPRSILGLLALACSVLIPARLVAAEDLVAVDARIAPALELLDASPSTRELRGVLEANHVSIQFVPMTAGMYARYSVARRVIEIDHHWAEVDAITLAAVIAHEATHAQDAVSGYLATGGADACLDSEIRAFRVAAEFWSEMYGVHGKPVVQGELERQLNLIAQRHHHDSDGLEAIVRQTYSGQCND